MIKYRNREQKYRDTIFFPYRPPLHQSTDGARQCVLGNMPQIKNAFIMKECLESSNPIFYLCQQNNKPTNSTSCMVLKQDFNCAPDFGTDVALVSDHIVTQGADFCLGLN